RRGDRQRRGGQGEHRHARHQDPQPPVVVGQRAEEQEAHGVGEGERRPQRGGDVPAAEGGPHRRGERDRGVELAEHQQRPARQHGHGRRRGGRPLACTRLHRILQTNVYVNVNVVAKKNHSAARSASASSRRTFSMLFTSSFSNRSRSLRRRRVSRRCPSRMPSTFRLPCTPVGSSKYRSITVAISSSVSPSACSWPIFFIRASSRSV